jgi:hypothetical protein
MPGIIQAENNEVSDTARSAYLRTAYYSFSMACMHV